jgi:hypothetical protein
MSKMICACLAMAVAAFGAPLSAQRITMKASRQREADYGILTIDRSGISFRCLRPGVSSTCSAAADRALATAYSAFEYCTFLDNRRVPGSVVGGKPIEPGGLGPLMWVFVKAKSEREERGYAVHDEDEASFMKAARLFGTLCIPPLALAF